MQLNNKVLKQFEGQNPVRKTSVNVTVELAPSELLNHLAKSYHYEIQRLNTARAGVIDELSVDDVFKYINTLIYMRVGKINHELSPSYLRLYRRVVVPVMVYQLSISIGEVQDDDYGINLFPAYTVNGDEILSADSMLDISDRLQMLETNGLAQVQGLPNDVSGDIEFMVMQYVNDEVLSYRKSHPVYGFLSAFFTRRMSEEITQGISRIYYGDVNTYRTQLAKVLAALDGGLHG